MQDIPQQGATPRPDQTATRQMKAEADHPAPTAERRAQPPATPQMGGAVFDDWASI